MNPALLEAITYWWAMRKKKSYIRPAHTQAALQRNSFAAFWRYYNSPEEMDLKRFLRLNKAEFDAVYSKIRFRLEGHCPTHLRPIQGTERLAVFLRFIAFGPSCCAVAHLFAIGDSTVFEICKEVSEAIKFYSIVLLAIADAESRFIAVDIGASGRNSDSTLWISSPLRMFLESEEASLPANQEDMLPYVFLGDGGFGCTDLIMTPFTDREQIRMRRLLLIDVLAKQEVRLSMHSESLQKGGGFSWDG
uniref:DDE Tnp4 domain-containing protein n=1 Tax=Ditylenchus dipsaci TaxID=166011 RepID=A0A915EJW1_9BILA